jgi:predicted ArsR family transcriptional regulator
MNRLDSLADPVRLRIVRHLADSPGATLPELATAAGVHLNTVRPHALALQEAGVVTRAPAAPEGRGRPRVGYRLADDWSPPTTDYLGLAELLAAAVLRAGQGTGELRALGREWGRYLQGRPGTQDFERDLPIALERLGFHARVEGRTLHLSACPCRRVLPDRPELVCELAVGVAEGLLTGSGSDLRVAARRHDPERRRCTVELAPRPRRGRPHSRARSRREPSR